MARRATAPTRVAVARIERAEAPPARDWRRRPLMQPFEERESFDLFAALTAQLVAIDPDEAAPSVPRRDARPAPAPAPVQVGPCCDAAVSPEDEPLLARLASRAGFSFEREAEGPAHFLPFGFPSLE